MTMFTLCFLLVSVMAFTASGQLASDHSGCPTDYLHMAMGCAYQPHCFSDSGCGSGHKCCPHTCGDYCYDMSTGAAATQSPDGSCLTLSCLFGDLFGRKK